MFIRSQLNTASLPVPRTIHDWLILSSAFSCFLVGIRVIVTGSPMYLFLIWNLFLAFVPYWISGWLIRNYTATRINIKFIIALSAWLLFIPNSFYIITDFFHLSRFRLAPKWFDLLMIFSFAWNGLIFGIISLRRVEILFTRVRKKRFTIFMIFVVMWLCAFGIYIGRYLRFNSWDIITDPFSLGAEIINMIIQPVEYGYAWGMTICYAVFMTLAYVTIKKMSESFKYTNT